MYVVRQTKYKRARNVSAQNVAQRRPVYIPQKNSPFAHLNDNKTVSIDSFSKEQKEQIFNSCGVYNQLPIVGFAYPNHSKVSSNKWLYKPIVTKGLEAQIDHIVPQSKGGGNTVLNAQILDARSNSSKRDRYPTECSENEGGARVYIPELSLILETYKSNNGDYIINDFSSDNFWVAKSIMNTQGWVCGPGVYNLPLDRYYIDIQTARNYNWAPDFPLPD